MLQKTSSKSVFLSGSEKRCGVVQGCEILYLHLSEQDLNSNGSLSSLASKLNAYDGSQRCAVRKIPSARRGTAKLAAAC